MAGSDPGAEADSVYLGYGERGVSAAAAAAGEVVLGTAAAVVLWVSAIAVTILTMLATATILAWEAAAARVQRWQQQLPGR